MFYQMNPIKDYSYPVAKQFLRLAVRQEYSAFLIRQHESIRNGVQKEHLFRSPERRERGRTHVDSTPLSADSHCSFTF